MRARDFLSVRIPVRRPSEVEAYQDHHDSCTILMRYLEKVDAATVNVQYELFPCRASGVAR